MNIVTFTGYDNQCLLSVHNPQKPFQERTRLSERAKNFPFMHNHIFVKTNYYSIHENVHQVADEDLSIPARSGFNALVSTKTVPVAYIRYLPFINASPSGMSTIFTTLLKLVRISEELGQHHILVKANLAIYSKAQRILWSRPGPLVGKVMMRLGAMHLIMAFLASIGKIFGDGGLQNILTSSDVYAAATVNQMLQGKQYARAIRGVRLAHEALSQMLISDFS